MEKLLTTIIFSLFLCLAISSPVRASVSGSAVVPDPAQKVAVEETVEVEEIDLKEAVELFSTGIACGIVFSSLMFVLSLVINLFFDIVRK